MAESVQRDRAWVEREYGREKWPSIEALIADAVAAEGEHAGLARVLGLVSAEERRGPGALTPHPTVAGGRRVELPRAAAFAAQEAIVVELLRERCTDDTDLVVELGAGWGRNLVAGWLGGLPGATRFVAAEITESGRRAADALGALEPRLALETTAFDFAAPDLSGVRGDRAVIYTVHAVEQVGSLPAELLDVILGVAQHVEVFHVEPVGFQVAGDTEASTAAYAKQHDYNRNLLDLLRDAAAEGRIELDPPLVDVVGVKADNSSSVVSWRTPSR